MDRRWLIIRVKGQGQFYTRKHGRPGARPRRVAGRTIGVPALSRLSRSAAPRRKSRPLQVLRRERHTGIRGARLVSCQARKYLPVPRSMLI